jgi:hypothetical protein
LQNHLHTQNTASFGKNQCRPTGIVDGMDTNERLRQRALRLIKSGVSQKVLAGRMGLSESTFSRWLNRVEHARPIPITALDGFETYTNELFAALANGLTEETQRSGAEHRATGTAGPTFRNGDRRHDSSGPPQGVPERRRQ